MNGFIERYPDGSKRWKVAQRKADNEEKAARARAAAARAVAKAAEMTKKEKALDAADAARAAARAAQTLPAPVPLPAPVAVAPGIDEIQEIFQKILDMSDTKFEQAKVARNAPFGKEVLVDAFIKFIASSIKNSYGDGGDSHDVDGKVDKFVRKLGLGVGENGVRNAFAIPTMVGKDYTTYISFNINILCNGNPLWTSFAHAEDPFKKNDPYWDAHLNVNATDKNTNLKLRSHITFAYYDKNIKQFSLHVYLNTTAGTVETTDHGAFVPTQINAVRLQAFQKLVFHFFRLHPDEMAEAAIDALYQENKVATGFGIAPPPNVHPRRRRRGGRGSRRFTFKKLLRKTLYTKKKRKAIKSTQKNKRRK